MTGYPPEVQQWLDLCQNLPGIEQAAVRPLPIDILTEDSLQSTDEELDDLPRAALWRTGGGSSNEVLLQTELRLESSGESLASLGKLAAWIEVMSRQGYALQLRVCDPAGETPRSLLELFLKTDPDDAARMMAAIEDLTASLSGFLA